MNRRRINMNCRRIEVRSVAATTRTKQRWFVRIVGANNRIEYVTETFSSHAKARNKAIVDGLRFGLPVWDRVTGLRYNYGSERITGPQADDNRVA